ncbi:EscU/YscU/HrcU family type III secretion system export apparatus switch protein [Fuscovulum ytuae]|uniref:EscU/YscU/HrcU family type III secretion system export apparatus switch protein n=1 Tax=Fuscovulum ytuae TaxID=3042299 RepID=A0ABY8Q2Q8_9RHOB|nr:EscU/YscU/HrcU family type III secretion system export apparatus switch protein [Fuscovulum sp. YMD61]WGV14928.1 EscU/YscU/HrcU family type III secretion system export apparatus switch protein [Fuscovulum sp. YMD61]
MADENDGAEKSHEPTQKRLDDAREEGNVLTSKEAMVFAGMAVGTGMLALSAQAMPSLLPKFQAYFLIQPGADLNQVVTQHVWGAFWQIIGLSVVVAVPVMLAVIGVQIAMGGMHWSIKAAGLKWNRIDPLAGIKRMVSATALVELGKAVAKVLVLGAVGWAMMAAALPALERLWQAGPAAGAAVMGDATLRLMWGMVLGLAAVAVLDVAWQWYSLRQKMMMTLQEVKEENKEQNGSPEVKGRLRQLQMEASRNASRRRKALDDVPRATAIVTNPTHFAVAIRYVPGETRAPMILAMGKGPMALEIMARGRKAGLAPMQIPVLARALYFTGDIGMEINEQLYAAVAAVLAHVYRLDRGEGSVLPDVDLPPELRFSEFGQPEARRYG